MSRQTRSETKLEEDIGWWENVLESALGVTIARNMDSMLAAVKTGVERRSSSAA